MRCLMRLVVRKEGIMEDFIQGLIEVLGDVLFLAFIVILIGAIFL